MAIMRVNPTRMELTRLKKRLSVARRGHKLLKDKRDELMKQFLVIVRKSRDLRKVVEEGLAEASKKFVFARAVMSTHVFGEAVMYPGETVGVEVTTKNIMNVNVPKMKFVRETLGRDSFPYGFAETSGELDEAIGSLSEVFSKMLELAETEKTVQLLADEIERTRRRVNALEYVLIPNLSETIRYITMKLDENERGNLTRLMKVKDMMLEQARTAQGI